MLTRKRLREGNHKKMSIGFHPIMESVTRFLHFKDCAQVTTMNQFFHQKMWLYLLRSTNRELNLNSIIIYNVDSSTWIRKYASELKYQSIHVSSKHVDFFSINIPQICDLFIMYCNYSTIRLPTKIQSLGIFGDIPNKIRNVKLNKFTMGNFSPIAVQTIPEDVKDLHIYAKYIWFQVIPSLPNVTRLNVYNCNEVQGIEKLMIQCPKLETIMSYSFERPTIGFEEVNVSQLILDYPNVTTMYDIHYPNVKTLDLSRCPKLLNYSNFKNVPNLITPNKK
jgi:hypothetical protein